MSRSLAKEVVVDARGGASVSGDVVACSIAGSRAGNGVAQELVETSWHCCAVLMAKPPPQAFSSIASRNFSCL